MYVHGKDLCWLDEPPKKPGWYAWRFRPEDGRIQTGVVECVSVRTGVAEHEPPGFAMGLVGVVVRDWQIKHPAGAQYALLAAPDGDDVPDNPHS